ncbi:MAG: hypothetical protein WA964_09700 [Ilumatobacter sp.]|uniref:hypothetical protein n=1 Tax=Ilumatobacter sp. TaxID=1967498 RepID=UPI003C75A49E
MEGQAGGFRVLEAIKDRSSRHEFVCEADVGSERARFMVLDDGSALIGVGDDGGFEPIAGSKHRGRSTLTGRLFL